MNSGRISAITSSRSEPEQGVSTGRISPKTLALVEPSANRFSVSKEYCRYLTPRTTITDLSKCGRQDSRKTTPGHCHHINVLEHIEDDIEDWEVIYETLAPGGRCLIFVSCTPKTGNFDREVAISVDIAKKSWKKNAGPPVSGSNTQYFDLAGNFPWFVKNRISQARC